MAVSTHRMVAFGEYVDDGTASAMKARDYKDATDLICGVAQTLRAEGFDASEDGTGRQNLIPIAHIETMPTLRPGASQEGAGHGARSGDCKDEYIVPVAFQSKASASQSMNPSIVTPSLDVSKAGGTAIAFQQNQLGEVRESAVSGTLNTNSNASGRNTPMAKVGMAVRRLTPVECERLQGFPDGYTNVPDAKGKQAADGPRYKALGNSWAVPNVAWIGRRIDMIDKILRGVE